MYKKRSQKELRDKENIFPHVNKNFNDTRTERRTLFTSMFYLASIFHPIFR